MQSNFYAGTRANAVSANAITFQRITAVRGCWVAFIVEGYSFDPAGKKIQVEVYRGSSSGTPGSLITGKAYDGELSALDPANVATVNDGFSSEAGYTTGDKIDDFTCHPQYHRPSKTYWLNPTEKLDIRLTVTDSGSNTGCKVTTNIRG